MVKGQDRSKRETKKPKQIKTKTNFAPDTLTARLTGAKEKAKAPKR